MRISTKVRYGTRALVELALSYPEQTVSVSEIAEKESISPKYLEHIMAPLKAAGLVVSTRGMHGGYELARPPEKITLSEVYTALEGSPAPVDCVDDPGSCPMEEVCPTFETWLEMKRSIQDILENTTLRCLAERKRSKTRATAPMYHI